MGDVNEKNVFVSPQAMVRLIDCDSYQINAGGQTYLCEVGVPLYTPPELQGQSFRGVVRTHNHDRFGLAVLIFHLLFVGRHPFAGRPLTKGELPPDKAIKEFRFAYSRAAAQLQIAPPPYGHYSASSPPRSAGSLNALQYTLGPAGSQATRPGVGHRSQALFGNS